MYDRSLRIPVVRCCIIRTMEALQSRSLAIVSLRRNVMRGGFHRSEALILSVLGEGARDEAHEGWLRVQESP
jgi:hypothetical protein